MVIETVEQWRGVMAQIQMGPKFLVFDTETTGVDPWHGDQIIGVSLLVPRRGLPPGSYYASFRSEVSENLPPSLIPELDVAFGDPSRLIIGHNIKFDARFLELEGLEIECRLADSMIAAHVANENDGDVKNGGSLKLETLCEKYIDSHAGDADRALEEWAKANGLKGGAKKNMARIPKEIVSVYAENDVLLSYSLYKVCLESVKMEGCEQILEEVMDYFDLCRRMENRGVLINPVTCRAMSEHAQERREDLRADMQVMVGDPDFNPGSVPQLRKVLGQKDTDRKALAVCKHPIAPLVDQYRRWEKADSAYFSAYLERRDAQNRVHSDVKVHGTISGRLSMSAPNLMALPKDGDFYGVKKVIEAPPGHLLASWDYNQAELRMLAYYTQDPFLLRAYREGLDIHQETADALGRSRNVAKTLNFSIVYGIGAPGLSKTLGVSEEEAGDILTRYHARIPGIKKLYRECRRHAETMGYIPMWTGRRRHFGPRTEKHKAMSNLIQGGVAELVRVAMLRLDKLFRETDVHIILQVHDDLVFEIPEGEVSYWMPLIERAMTDFDFSRKGDPDTRVAIKSDGKIGKTLGSMERWTGSDSQTAV